MVPSLSNSSGNLTSVLVIGGKHSGRNCSGDMVTHTYTMVCKGSIWVSWREVVPHKCVGLWVALYLLWPVWLSTSDFITVLSQRLLNNHRMRKGLHIHKELVKDWPVLSVVFWFLLVWQDYSRKPCGTYIHSCFLFINVLSGKTEGVWGDTWFLLLSRVAELGAWCTSDCTGG